MDGMMRENPIWTNEYIEKYDNLQRRTYRTGISDSCKVSSSIKIKR